MAKKTRALAVISGRVQGVYFRMETKHEADRTGVCGWVRNQEDGTVEATFEGAEDRVVSIIEWCKKGPPLSRVANVDVRWSDFQDEFKDFKITF